MIVYVVIVTYNGIKWVEECFSSLRNSAYPIQTIVIDNGSTDGTIELVARNFKEVHLIKSKINLGFGKANNMGIRLAYSNDADFIFLLNQDAWIERDTIGDLVNVSLKYP